MSITSAMRSSSSGLFAERMRMDTISANIANANSMKTADKDAYRRKMVMLTEGQNGVSVQGIKEDMSPFRESYEPGNPLANAQGIVLYSNVNPIAEMVNLMSATRSYEANIAAFNSGKGMIRAALNIGKI